MARFILRRVLLGILTVLGVSLVVFVATRLSGDVVQLLAAPDASAEDLALLRAELGLDQPMPVQYLYFLGDLLQGDLGTSIRYRQPVVDLIGQRLPATLELATAAFALALVAGIIAGTVSAVRRGSAADRILRILAVLGQSMPHFWLGIMAILLFSITLGWLPSGGRDGWLSLVMPAVTLAVFPAASIMRVTRSAMLENLNAEYVRFLKVKGNPEADIVLRHVLRNSLIPVIALAGLQISNLLGGSVIVEAIYNWPGLGTLIVEAIIGHDYAIVQGAVLLLSIVLVCINLAVDLIFGLIDPRVTYR